MHGGRGQRGKLVACACGCTITQPMFTEDAVQVLEADSYSLNSKLQIFSAVIFLCKQYLNAMRQFGCEYKLDKIMITLIDSGSSHSFTNIEFARRCTISFSG